MANLPSTTRQRADHAADTQPTLPTEPALLAAAAELLWRAGQGDDPAAWLTAGLPVVHAALGGDYVALASTAAGRWSALAEIGTARSLPVELLAETLDRETARAQSHWVAVPLAPRSAEAEVLLAHVPPAADVNRALAAVEQLAPVLHQALAAVRRRARDQRRLRRLEAILEIASQWNQTREVEPLLVQMAEAATRLLRADRASIFLWDRPNHTLVGRPALGVPGGELRIPDDRGVVGQVIQTGEPRRVDAATEPEAIDRHVDAQLRYQTRTLLCVPLARPVGRAVRRVRADQQARGQLHARTTKRRWSNWPPMPPWRWKTPRTASSCSRPIGRSPSRRPRRCG